MGNASRQAACHNAWPIPDIMLYSSVLCNRATKQTSLLYEFCCLEGGTDFRQRNTWVNWDTTMKGKYGILRNYSAGYVLVYFVWSKKLLQGDPSKLRPRSGSKSGDKSPPNPAGGRGDNTSIRNWGKSNGHKQVEGGHCLETPNKGR